MRTIWKYVVPIEDEIAVAMPNGARVLSVGTEGYAEHLAVWAEVDSAAPLVDVPLAIRGTGHPLREVGPYIGTVQAPPFVWHIYHGATK